MNGWMLILGMMAVLTAISVPEILSPGGTFSTSYTNAHLVAGIIAIAAAWRTRNLLVTIVSGMVVFFARKYAFGLQGLPTGS